MPASTRGSFTVDDILLPRAEALGLTVRGVSGASVRIGSIPPKAKVEPGPQALVASYGDMKVARRMGYRRFAFIEHGIGQSYAGTAGPAAHHGSYAGGEDREDVEVFLLPNARSAGRWAAAYPRATIRVVGSPHLDAIPCRTAGPEPRVAVSFHWNASHISPEAGTAFGHFVGVLPDLAREFDVVGHAHPRFVSRLAERYRRAGITTVTEFDEVCRMADLYICDNSSSMYEFAATGRPVVVLNAPTYRRHVDHGLRFWEAADVGLQVDRPEDLLDAVRLALTDPPDVRARREAALDIVYARRAGASQMAADTLVGWAAESGDFVQQGG